MTVIEELPLRLRPGVEVERGGDPLTICGQTDGFKQPARALRAWGWALLGIPAIGS